MKNIKTAIYSYMLMTAGAFITALGTMFFMVPNDIAPAGFTGIAAVINSVFGLPVGITVLLLNVPFFAFAYKEYGKKFFIRTLYALILYSVFTDVVPETVISSNELLSCAVGGVLYGVGIGFVLKGEGTTGGTELVAKLLLKKFRKVSIGNLIFIIDIIILTAACFVFGIEKTLYATGALFISSKVIDRISGGSVLGRAYFIFSDKTEEIYSVISERLQRGGTFIYTKGAYYKKDGFVLLCIVFGRIEAVELKNTVYHADKKAFVVSVSVSEVFGQGFDKLKEGSSGSV